MAAPRINISSNIMMCLLILPLFTLCWASTNVSSLSQKLTLVRRFYQSLYKNQLKEKHCVRTNAIGQNANNVQTTIWSANLRINIVQSRLKWTCLCTSRILRFKSLVLFLSLIQNLDEVFLISSCSAPNRRHHMDIVVKTVAFAHQEYQERPVCLVPRVFRVCRAHKEEAWVQRETKVIKEILESKAPQALRDIMGQQDITDQQDLRDHPDHRGRKATKGT